ncbi:hypothetical protein BT96DRAFT_1080107 [Gymnopus androsaceus JB14]|uniref:Uncharacterized protein n=1 Tax=Gymnopus androsaceus JB14 TaxID=1447944 RepID=A0A6A4HZ95_9AGAR|nr:hypothetical protein BT96DRAFT_1080107 [Gymnopus androsaceus JB14]
MEVLNTPLEERMQKTVMVKIWNVPGGNPIVIPVYCDTFPLFCIEQCQPFANQVMHGDPSALIATYEVMTGQWQFHGITTTQIIPFLSMLLYCTLPSGIAGQRIMDCPGLDEDVVSENLLHSMISTPPPFGTSQRPWRQWPKDFTVREFMVGMPQVILMQDPALKEQSFLSAFSGVKLLVSGMFRCHKKLFNTAASSNGLLEANMDLLWVDLVSFLENTRPKSCCPVTLPVTFLTTLSPSQPQSPGPYDLGQDDDWSSSLFG